MFSVACRIVLVLSILLCWATFSFAQSPRHDREIVENVIYHLGRHIFMADEPDDANAADMSSEGDSPTGLGVMAPMAMDSDLAGSSSTTGSGGSWLDEE